MIDVGPLFIRQLSLATSSSRICCINVSDSPDCQHVRSSSPAKWQTMVFWKKIRSTGIIFHQICSFYVEVSTKICNHLLDFRLSAFLCVRSGAFGWGTALQVGRSRFRFPIG